MRVFLGWLLIVIACLSVVWVFASGLDVALQRETAEEPPDGLPPVPHRPATLLDLTGALGLAILCLIVAARLLARRKEPASQNSDTQS